MPNNIKVTSGEQSNSNTKKVNDKTLIRATTADGEVRWIDPEDYRDFNGKIGYAFYNDKGERVIENGQNQFTQWLRGKSKPTLEQVNKIAAAMGYPQQDLDNAAYTERMENSVYAKDRPLKSVYPEFYLLTGARGLANGAFTPIWNAVKPGGYMWANPITKQILASEAAARGMDATSIGLTGKTIADNLYSGNNPYLRFAAESANPGYWMPYSGFKPAWEALNEYKVVMKDMPWKGSLQGGIGMPSRLPVIRKKSLVPPSEYSPRQLSDGRYVINDPDNPGKSILWDKYLEKTGQGQTATNLGYNPQQIAKQATKDFNNSILQRVINENKLLSDLADKIKSGKATTQFATGRRTIVNPSSRDVLAGEYLDATKGKQVRGVGLVNTTPVEVTTTGEEVYAGRGNFGVNSFSVTNSKRASTKYGAIDYEKLTNDTQHSKVLTDQEKNEIFDIMKRMKEIDKNPLPKMKDNTQGKFKVTPEEELEYISLGERLNELVPGTFEYGAKNRHILFRAPEERQILDISSTNNNFGYQKETLGLNLFDYRNAPVKSYTPAGNLKSGNFGNMVDAERTIGGYYKDSSLYGRQLVKGWNQSDKVMELLKLRYPHLFPLRIPKNYRFYVRGTGPNGVSGDVDMITLQAPNGGVPGFKFGNKLNYYKKQKFKF